MNKSNNKKTVIITGAAGYVGSRLAAHFVKKGFQVVGLVRNASSRKAAGVKYVEYDLEKPFDDSVFEGADYLIHTAYVKYDKQHPDALQINVDAAKRLIEASRKHKLKHNVFMSSMSSHEGGVSVYARQKLAIEKVFNGERDTVLRAGLIVGDGGIVKQMSGFMRSKRMVPLVGGGKQPLQIIGVYDLVNLIDAVLTKGKSGLYTVANPRVYSYKDFYAELSKALGIKVLFVPVPYGAILGVMRLASALHLPLSANEENLQGLKMLIAVDTKKDLKALGMELDDLETALSKTSL
jgi:nucleoside-diphosphate-sugar epimerase